MVPRLCSVCGRPEIRQHRHGRDMAGKLNAARFNAELRDRWLAMILRDARAVAEHQARAG